MPVAAWKNWYSGKTSWISSRPQIILRMINVREHKLHYVIWCFETRSEKLQKSLIYEINFSSFTIAKVVKLIILHQAIICSTTFYYYYM